MIEKERERGREKIGRKEPMEAVALSRQGSGLRCRAPGDHHSNVISVAGEVEFPVYHIRNKLARLLARRGLCGTVAGAH